MISHQVGLPRCGNPAARAERRDAGIRRQGVKGNGHAAHRSSALRYATGGARRSAPSLPRSVLSMVTVGLLALLTLLIPLHSAAGETNHGPTVLVVVGASGDEQFATNFVEQAVLWTAASERAGARRIEIGRTPGGTNDVGELKAALEAAAQATDTELWLVLIGHGTFDGKEARFNLRGPDVSASELAAWLKPMRRPLAVINTTSASSPFLKALAGTNRVVITATRSGYEQSVARFGAEFAKSLSLPSADLDQDGQTSLLELFLNASAQVAESYKTQGRLLTEHALLDDNGDGMGTPAEWFRGLRSTKKPDGGGALDGLRAHQWNLIRSAEEAKLSVAQRARRDQLELAIAGLRDRKAQLSEEVYWPKLESLLVELAHLYRGTNPPASTPLPQSFE